MAPESEEPCRQLPISAQQRMRLNETWRIGLTSARAARIIDELEAAPLGRGDNEERRRKRIEIIRMYAGVGHPRLAQVEIAAKIGVTHQRVHQVLAKVGMNERAFRVTPALTPKCLRQFARRMKAYLAAAGYRQCYSCAIVTPAEDMATRNRGPWRALCKPCYSEKMRVYRTTGTYSARRVAESN